MAIRVLGRYILHRIRTSESKSFSSLSNLKPQYFPINSPDHKKLNSFKDVFQRYGFLPSQFRDFISNNPFLMNSNPSEIEKSLKILLSLDSSREFLVSMVYHCPRVLEYEFLKNWEVGFSRMGKSIATSLMIRNVLEVSRRFRLGPTNVFECVQNLKGLGFSDGTVTKVLEEFPMVIMMNKNGIREKIEFLVGIGISRNQTDRIFKLYPCIVAYGVQNKLKPLFDEFEDIGFGVDVVRREISRDPSVLGLELGELSRCLHMLSTLKCRVPIKEKIYSKGAFRAGLDVKRRVDCLCRHGLIRRDAFKVLWKEPRILLYDIVDIEKKIEFLVCRMKFDVLWLVDVPEYLGVSFEKQIVARFNVIEYLRSKGGLGDEVTLKGMIKLSRRRFYNLYVKPYPECEKMFGEFAGDVMVKNQHPAGLWKLFEPKKYPKSEEDLNNIKYFMESLA